MTKIYTIIIIVLFIALIIKKVKQIREIIVPAKQQYVQISIVLIIFILLTYLYAKTILHYMFGILAIPMFTCFHLAVGITSKGFLSNYRYKQIILWNEIEKFRVIKSNHIKIKVSGGFMMQTFYFKNSDYDRIINILEEKLPKKVLIEITHKN